MTRVDRSFAPLFALCLVAVATLWPMSAAARPERPAIRLSCPAGPGQAEALCRAVIQALARAAPGHVVRRVPPGQEPPPRPGDLGVALQLRPGGQARLVWQPPDGAAQPGPGQALPDATAGFSEFAETLVQAGPGAAFLTARISKP